MGAQDYVKLRTIMYAMGFHQYVLPKGQFVEMEKFLKIKNVMTIILKVKMDATHCVKFKKDINVKVNLPLVKNKKDNQIQEWSLVNRFLSIILMSSPLLKQIKHLHLKMTIRN